jgi:hypothetical protein
MITARATGVLVKIAVSTGGSGYSSVPSVQLTGVPVGPGAPGAIAIMSGTRVESIHVTARGAGLTQNPTVTVVGGGGSGAAATAYAYTGTLRPVSFYKGRYNDLYGVDGMGRGFRWDGAAATVDPIGLVKPQTPPTITAVTATDKQVASVQLINEGAGYFEPPSVSFTGGGGSGAGARAQVFNGRVISLQLTTAGSGYTSSPEVTISGGVGGGATLTVGVTGSVDNVQITAQGSGYTNAGSQRATMTIAGDGISDAVGEVLVSTAGEVTGVNLISAGTGATGTAVTVAISGGGGASGASAVVNMSYRVGSVGVSDGGSGFFVPPIITVLPAAGDTTGSGAAVTCSVAAGVIQSCSVLAGGQYSAPPSALVLNTSAEAMATLSAAMEGEYRCCYRYIDATPVDQAGPKASSISDLKTVTGTNGSFTWAIDTTNADARATAVELWRTTADQSVVLFRVATIQRANWASTYSDTLTDKQLTDTTRDGYGLMPLTLPSGQVNARRFEIPPPEFAVACMFQDRAWYALDVTGERPNTLFYSEVDEPESVPQVNELILQENIADSDKIVGLIPFGTQLLVAQQAHLYSVSYVAQPVIDASIRLVSYRGVLNNACWSVLGGVVFLVDSYGMYAFDGSSEQAVSVAVDNYWRDGVIDFSKADTFHVSADLTSKIVRFFYCKSSDSEPTRALCYCTATKAWWEETYNTARTASCSALLGQKMTPVFGLSSGGIVKESGLSDSGTAIPYQYKTGALPLSNEKGSRAISVLYNPTTNDANLGVRLYYNNSDTARPNAIASDRGSGFTTTTGSTEAVINQKLSRSALGDATGLARAYYSGRVDDMSAGGDRHVSVELAGSQAGASSTDDVVIRGVIIEGAG